MRPGEDDERDGRDVRVRARAGTRGWNDRARGEIRGRDGVRGRRRRRRGRRRRASTITREDTLGGTRVGRGDDSNRTGSGGVDADEGRARTYAGVRRISRQTRARARVRRRRRVDDETERRDETYHRGKWRVGRGGVGVRGRQGGVRRGTAAVHHAGHDAEDRDHLARHAGVSVRWHAREGDV